MIGPMEPDEASLPFGLIDKRIARNDGAVRHPHDQGRIIGAAIGIDEKARKCGHERRTAEPLGEAARHRLDPDVIGNMPFELLGRQTERAIFLRNGISGVIGEEDDAPPQIAGNPVETLVLCVIKACFKHCGLL